MKNAFDLILRQIPREELQLPLEDGQVIYVHNPRRGSIAPFTNGVFRSLFVSELERYYLANPSKRVFCPPIRVELTDASNQSQTILVQTKIEGIEASRVAATIVRLATPGKRPFEVFAESMGASLMDFVEQRQAAGLDPMADFTSELQIECGTHLAAFCHARFGMKVSCALRFPEKDLNIGPLNIDLQDVLVRDDEETLSARLELTVLPPEIESDRELALQRVRPVAKLKEQVSAIALVWFRESCSLEDFCYQPSEVRKELEKQIRPYFQGLCLQLSRFRLNCHVPFKHDFNIREDFEVSCTVEPGRIPVRVQHKLLLKRNDIALLRRARVADLEDWVSRLLNSKTKATFFDKRYVDVVMDFGRLSDQIKEAVKGALQTIGFEANQHITIPADEQMRNWIDRTLSFDTGSQEFRTSDSTVKYRLSIQARVRFLDFEEVKDSLGPNKNLEEEFKDVAIQAAAEKLRSFSPEQLYLRFSDRPSQAPLSGESGISTQDGAVEETGRLHRGRSDQIGVSPEEATRTEVAERLLETFNAKIENITLTPEASPLTELYAAICPAKNHTFEIAVDARGRLGEPIVYAIDYRVVGIAAWNRFQELCTNARGRDTLEKANEIFEAIDQMLRNPAISIMQGLPPDHLRSVRADKVLVTKMESLDQSAKLVTEHYGLNIAILSFRPLISGWDRQHHKRVHSKYDALISELEDLHEERLRQERDLGPEDSTVRELGMRIEAKEREIDTYTPEHDAEFEQTRVLLENRKEAGFLAGQARSGQAAFGGRALPPAVD